MASTLGTFCTRHWEDRGGYASGAKSVQPFYTVNIRSSSAFVQTNIFFVYFEFDISFSYLYFVILVSVVFVSMMVLERQCFSMFYREVFLYINILCWMLGLEWCLERFECLVWTFGFHFLIVFVVWKWCNKMYYWE